MATETVKESAEVVRREEPKAAEIQSRWSSGVTVPINMPVDESWVVFSDFANPQLMVTGPMESKIVEGEANVVNCVRFVKGPSLDGSGETCFANERLLSLDEENHILTYRLEDNSFGFVNYEGYMKVTSGNDDTSFVTWSLEMDPLPGLPAPPNLCTQMMTDTFKMFIKNVESKYLKKKGVEVASPAVVPATA